LLGVLYHAVLGEQWSGSRVAAQGLVLLAVLVGALALLLWLRRRSRRVPTTIRIPENADLIAFRMGVLVYVATFVVGNSFDYRLVFLLLVLPQLLRWPVADRNGRRAVDLPRVAMVLVLLELWISTLSQQLRLWDEAVSWALAGMLLVLLLRSLPSLGSLGKSEESDDYSAAGVGDPEGGH
jgi:hypothetical protein